MPLLAELAEDLVALLLVTELGLAELSFLVAVFDGWFLVSVGSSSS